ncbi:MAG: DNA adenine methylase [Flavobacteriales bacterium]
MNYIGSKKKLIPFLQQTIFDVVGKDLSKLVFGDLFAGTGIVGRSFKAQTKQIIANDLEYYSFVLNRNYIGNHKNMNCEEHLKALNKQTPIEGFIAKNYCSLGKSNRLYFSLENGKKIDAVRQQIERWKLEKAIDKDQYFFLLASLLESADKVANIASVYGAYLKKIKTSAAKPLIIEPASFERTNNHHLVFQHDSNELIKTIEGDILYLDPPYNARQYGANYHVLNTIAKYDIFVPKGITGLRSYNKSNYCKKGTVLNSFTELLKNAQFKYIFLSYNNEGLMSAETVKNTMKLFGRYSLATTKYQRFKADKTENRNHKASHTTEFLHILEKN